MRDPVIRALRTAAQSFLAYIVGSGVLTMFQTEGSVSASVVEKALVGAGFAALSALVSFAQNWLEDSRDVAIGVK